MRNAKPTNATFHLESCCYRLTAIGRARVDVVEIEHETLGSLPRHLHDVLMMCGSGMWFEQLRQFMPPRSLDESLRALLNLGLIEVVRCTAPKPVREPESGATPWARAVNARFHQRFTQLPM